MGFINDGGKVVKFNDSGEDAVSCLEMWESEGDFVARYLQATCYFRVGIDRIGGA